MIGRGGMATVFHGRDELLARDVAVKVFGPIGTNATGSQQEFLREARAAAALSHPSIAGVYDVGVNGPERFIVMEYVPGGSLADLLQDEAPLAPRRAVQITSQLADALDYGHRHGIIHCDVKPQNVLLDESGRPKLVDFGISRSSAATTALTDTVSGTAGYIAPEQLLGDPVDGRADVYALGCVAYELLSGELPFDAANLAALASQRLRRPPVPLNARNSKVPTPLATAVMRAIQRNPADRYANGHDFARALRSSLDPAVTGTGALRNQTTVLASRSPQATNVLRRSPPDSEMRSGSLSFWALLGGGVLAVVLAVAFATYVLPSLLSGGAGGPVSVPSVTNEPLDSTTVGRLQQAGLTIAVTFRDTTKGTACTGTILEQAPAGSTSVASGSAVRLVVSRNDDC